MSYRIVAFHYPKPQFRDELLQRLVRAAELIKAAPGCMDVEVWTEQARGALVSTAKFDSRESCMSSLRTIGQIAQATDLEERAREIYDLVEPGQK